MNRLSTSLARKPLRNVLNVPGSARFQRAGSTSTQAGKDARALKTPRSSVAATYISSNFLAGGLVSTNDLKRQGGKVHIKERHTVVLAGGKNGQL